jgi:hypothetical protein
LADATDFIDVCTTASLAENGLIGRCSRSQPCNTGTHVRSFGAQTGLDQSARDDDVVAHMDRRTGTRGGRSGPAQRWFSSFRNGILRLAMTAWRIW